MVNMLIAGFDDANGPELYFMDWLASLQKVSMLRVVVTARIGLPCDVAKSGTNVTFDVKSNSPENCFTSEFKAIWKEN